MKVEVYRNLRDKCYSVRDFKTKLVIAREKVVYLKNVSFKVFESQRQRVLREKQKNVHALVVGEWVDKLPKQKNSIKISYNPYKLPYFYNVENEEKVSDVKNIRMMEDFTLLGEV